MLAILLHIAHSIRIVELPLSDSPEAENLWTGKQNMHRLSVRVHTLFLGTHRNKNK